MRAAASAAVAPGGLLRHVRSAPPLTLRKVRHEDGDVCRVCLVGTAAGPLAGDDLGLQLTIDDGARAELVSAGASIAQGRGHGLPARVRMTCSIGAGAELVAAPAPVVVCAGSRLHLDVRLRLAATATASWRELVVLGRSDEPPGEVSLGWDVERAGRPVLRQRVDLTQAWLLGWAGMLAGRRVLATTLLSGPSVRAVTTVLDPTAVAQQVDGSTLLCTVLDTSAHAAERRMDHLLGQVSGATWPGHGAG